MCVRLTGFACGSGHYNIICLPFPGLQSVLLRGDVGRVHMLWSWGIQSRFGRRFRAMLTSLARKPTTSHPPFLLCFPFCRAPALKTKQQQRNQTKVVLRDLSYRAQPVDLYGVRAYRLRPLHGRARQRTLPSVRAHLQVWRVYVCFKCFFAFLALSNYARLCGVPGMRLETSLWLDVCHSGLFACEESR